MPPKEPRYIVEKRARKVAYKKKLAKQSALNRLTAVPAQQEYNVSTSASDVAGIVKQIYKEKPDIGRADLQTLLFQEYGIRNIPERLYKKPIKTAKYLQDETALQYAEEEEADKERMRKEKQYDEAQRQAVELADAKRIQIGIEKLKQGRSKQRQKGFEKVVLEQQKQLEKEARMPDLDIVVRPFKVRDPEARRQREAEIKADVRQRKAERERQRQEEIRAEAEAPAIGEAQVGNKRRQWGAAEQGLELQRKGAGRPVKDLTAKDKRKILKETFGDEEDVKALKQKTKAGVVDQVYEKYKRQVEEDPEPERQPEEEARGYGFKVDTRIKKYLLHPDHFTIDKKNNRLTVSGAGLSKLDKFNNEDRRHILTESIIHKLRKLHQ